MCPENLEDGKVKWSQWYMWGEMLKVWLQKVYNRILTLEEFPDCFKEGIVVPIYKRQGKDPLLVNSYRGITISSILSKVLEIILLQRLSPILNDSAFPDQLQTAYQKGITRIDATFTTQETLTCHLRDGDQPYLCLFDMEKAFDSVEIPVLLKYIFNAGINGKFWRIIKSWYTLTRLVVFVLTINYLNLILLEGA